MPDTIWCPDLSQSTGPKYLSLVRALRDAVREGDLTEAQRLPTVRDLAWRLGMTPGTVARAYQIATQEGLLSGEVGRGTFVAARNGQPKAQPKLYVKPDERMVDLRSPALPDVGQAAVFAAALRGIADRMGPDWLTYPSQTAEAPLREAVVGWLSDRVMGPISADDIVLSNGGQNAIALVMQACLSGEKPVVLLEDLAYPGIRQAASLVRAEAVGLEMDAEGLRPDALEGACRRIPSAQLLCLTPQAQNPTAVCMSARRRSEIAAVARRYDLKILEDDCYTISDSDVPQIRAVAPERTWYVGSLSKSISAALRFGYIVCPPGQGEAGRSTATHQFFALARPVSDLCLDLLTSGAGERIRADVIAELGPRLQMVVNMLGVYDLSWQAGLPFVWLRMPKGWRASSFARRAEAEGVLMRSADTYALNHGRAPNAVRLAIAGNLSRSRFEGGIATLARLLANPPQELSV